MVMRSTCDEYTCECHDILPDIVAALEAMLKAAVDYKFEHWAASIEDACKAARAALQKAGRS